MTESDSDGDEEERSRVQHEPYGCIQYSTVESFGDDTVGLGCRMGKSVLEEVARKSRAQRQAYRKRGINRKENHKTSTRRNDKYFDRIRENF